MPSRLRLSAVASSVAIATVFTAAATRAQTKVWTTTPDFNTGTLNNAADTDRGGAALNAVVLGPTAVSKTRLVWTDNFNYGLVVRLDSTTGKQTARFDSVLNTINGVSTGLRPANEVCNWSNLGNCPGRLAIDTNGDAWIVNRAFGTQGSLTKFSGDIAHCIDRNNNGMIDTSADKTGDGVIDMSATGAAREYYGQEDECILTTIPVGAFNGLPRGVAVDRWGKVWVGTFNEGKVYRFNPNDPVSLEMTVTTGGNPYSIATGGDYLFVSTNGGSPGTRRVNVLTGAVDTAPCPATYGIVADPGGTVAWLGSWSNSASGMYRADFTTHTCTLMSNAGKGASTAVTLDAQPAPGPYVWAANYGSNSVSKYRTDGTYIDTYVAPPTSQRPHGLSPDFDGFIWLTSDVETTHKQLTKFNPQTGMIVSQAFIGFLASDLAKFPDIGGSYSDAATPYLYSDYTGVQIDRQSPYTYLGNWDGVYDGGAAGIPWSKVSWTALAPQYTTLTVSARAADSVAALGTTAYTLVTNGAVLTDLKGRYVQVRTDLKGPGWVTSQLNDITVNGPCGTLGAACCVKDTDCNDGNLCTADSCPTPGGACAHTAIPNCCNTNADCDDGNACTSDSCPGAGQQCAHQVVAGCCNSNADCDDADLCSTDICSGMGGTCMHPAINGCCLVDLDCTKGNKCSAATCPVPGGFCTGGAIPGCCNVDSDCADTDLCTIDACGASTNTCANTAITGCCNLDVQCDDGDACTQDTCSGLGGTCAHAPIAGCCSPGDPVIGTPCGAPVSPHDHVPCKAGAWACNNGVLSCEGAVAPATETCNGIDDDCDGVLDPVTTCPSGEVCVNGACRAPCSPDCPTGFACVAGYCVPSDGGAPDSSVDASGDVSSDTSVDAVSEETGAAGSGQGGAAGTAGAAGSAGQGTGGVAGHAGTAGAAGQGAAAGAGGTGQPATPDNAKDEGGCACATPGRPATPASQLALIAGALALAIARRRRNQGRA